MTDPAAPPSASSGDRDGAADPHGGSSAPGRHAAEPTGVRAEDITRVVLRPLASPLPMAFLALGIGTFLVAMQQLSIIPMSEMKELYLLLAVFVAPVQITAALLSFQTREPLVASGIGLIALTWPASAVVSYASQTPMTPKSLSLLYLAVSGALLLISLPAVPVKPLLGLVIAVAASRFILTGVYGLDQAHKVELSSAALGFLLVLLTGYAAVATGLEDTRHETVLPTGRRGEARDAFNGDLGYQIASVATEAGVRRQL